MKAFTFKLGSPAAMRQEPSFYDPREKRFDFDCERCHDVFKDMNKTESTQAGERTHVCKCGNKVKRSETVVQCSHCGEMMQRMESTISKVRKGRT